MAVTDTEVQEADVEDASGPSRPAPVLDEAWPRGTDHKAVGSLFVVVALVFLVATAVLALVMRAQLATPEADIVGDRTYRQLFTMHGVMGVFLFLLPVWLGLGSAIVPLQVGAARMPFPRLHAMSF